MESIDSLLDNNAKLIFVDASNNSSTRFDGRSLHEFREIIINHEGSENSGITAAIGKTKIMCESSFQIVNGPPELRKFKLYKSAWRYMV